MVKNKKERTLEEIAENVRKGIRPSPFQPVEDFETKVKRIARAFGSDGQIHTEGSHRDIIMAGHRIHWSPRQKGNEYVISSGVFDEAVERVSRATGIPSDLVKLYFEGSGTLYKRFRRSFEEKYNL